MKRLSVILSVVALVPVLFWGIRYYNVDLWFDEVYSLETFALKDWSSTLFYYPYPNNHILQNVTTQFLSRFLGLRDVFSIVENVYVFRIFQLVIALFTAWFTGKLAQRFFSFQHVALIYVAVFTTIPLMNYSMQLRGYNLSALFTVMLVYYSLGFIQKPKISTAIIPTLTTVLLLYTIPSNLYFVASLGLWCAVHWLLSLKKTGLSFKSKWFYLGVSVFIGSFLSLVLYLPIIEDVIFNEYSNRSAYGPLANLRTMVYVLFHFISSRYLLFVLGLFGLYHILKRKRNSYNYIFIAFLLLCPFVLSILHHKMVFQRLFSPLAPLFCLLIVVPSIKILEEKFSNNKQRLAFSFISVYCILTFISQVHKSDKIIERQLEANYALTQNSLRNFYLAKSYAVDYNVSQLNQISIKAPVFLYRQEDKPSVELYLRKYNIKYQLANTRDEILTALKSYKDVMVLTSYKSQTISEFKSEKSIGVKSMSTKTYFVNCLRLKWTSN